MIAAAAFGSGRFAYLNPAAPPSFYQAAFGPAVMIATGAGFTNPVLVPGSAFDQFLGMRLDSLDASQATAESFVPLDQYQHAHRYLLTAVGYWWRVAGISWSEIATLAGALHALAVLSVYALLRLFVPVTGAALGALWFSVTPLQLAYVPQFRDYAKGAFVLAALPLIVTLVLRSLPGRRLIIVAAATGLVIGVGFGFRMDVAVMLPIGVAVMVLFRGRRPWSDARAKALGVTVMALAFFVAAGPILMRLTTGGSNVSHVILLGYGEWFDPGLRIEAAPYRLFPYYSDDYMYYTLRSRGEAALGRRIHMPSPEYERVGMELLRDVVRLLPADVATRMLGSVNGILNLAFLNREPAMVERPFPPHVALRPAYAWLDGWRDRGVWLGALFVLVACARSIRLGAFAATLLLLLAAYPAIQFDPRHYFHLQAVPIALLVILVWGMVSALAARLRRTVAPAGDLEAAGWRGPALRMAIGGAVLVGVTVAPVAALRSYQRHGLESAFQSFLQQPGSRVDAEFEPGGNGRWIARWPGMQGRPTLDGDLASAFYVVEFHTAEDRATLVAAIRHVPTDGSCPRVLILSTGPGASWMAFPAYSALGGAAFDGLEVGPETKERIFRIIRHDSGPAGLPFELRLSGDWPHRRLFQALGIEGHAPEPDVRIAAHDVPCEAPLQYADALLNPALAPTTEAVDRMFTGNVTVGSGGVVMDGKPDPAAYVVQFRPVVLAAGDALVASVIVEEGGVTIGLVKDDAWHRNVTLDRPGESVVAVPVSESGTYLPMVGNAQRAAPRSRFTIPRLGIVTHAGEPRGLVTSREAEPE